MCTGLKLNENKEGVRERKREVKYISSLIEVHLYKK
jgi:hypothetical protein